MKVVELNPNSDRRYPSTVSATHVVLTLAARGLDSSSFRDGQRLIPALLIGDCFSCSRFEAIFFFPYIVFAEGKKDVAIVCIKAGLEVLMQRVSTQTLHSTERS